MLLVALSAHAAAPPPIVNGQRTSLYPQVVMLRHATPDWSLVYVCSGTLVARDWVLTAAHCTVDEYGEGLTEMHVFVGNAWTADAEEIAADAFFPHPDYYVSPDGGTIDNDLGLVHLSAPIDDLEPLPLNTAPFTDADVGEVLRWVGWGATGDYAYDAGEFKRYADMPIVGLEDEFILAYDDGGAATCGGDSGGAVLRQDEGGGVTLVAAHTFGRDDDGTLCDGSTSGDTRVDLYTDWIRTNIGSPDDGGTGDDTGASEDTGQAPVRHPHDGGGEEDGGGCACGTTGTAGTGLFGLLLGMAIAARRRG